MVAGIAELASARKARLLATLGGLDSDELSAQVRHSYQENERSIDEWNAFVEGRERALRAMRTNRQSRAHAGRPLTGLVAS